MKYLMIFVLCSVAFAQDAVVIELSKTDAITAKTLYDAKIKSDQAWELFNGKLKETYKNAYDGVSFYSGIQFSKDFRFIVPKPYSSSSGTCGQNYWSNGCTFSSPLQFSTPTTNDGWVVR
jgi:hypothetical protein